MSPLSTPAQADSTIDRLPGFQRLLNFPAATRKLGPSTQSIAQRPYWLKIMELPGRWVPKPPLYLIEEVC